MKSSMSLGKEREHCLLERTKEDGNWKRVSFRKRRFLAMQRVLVEFVLGIGIIVEVKFDKGDVGRRMFVSSGSVDVSGKEVKARKRGMKGSILNEIVLNVF